MILSSRPTDRRQLIEEAAGITKYKSRRRAAELKLEAAQQNLTRIDDIVFEVEKQRGVAQAPGRQGAPLPAAARRDAALGEGAVRAPLPRSWPRRSNRPARASGGRARARDRRRRPGWPRSKPISSRLRIELAEAEQRAARDARSRPRARARDQPPAAAARARRAAGRACSAARATELDDELAALEARREPARLRSRRGAPPRPRRTARATRPPRRARRGQRGVRRGAARIEGARGGRRSGARRRLRGRQHRDGAAARHRARRRRRASAWRETLGAARGRGSATSTSKRPRVEAERDGAAAALQRRAASARRDAASHATAREIGAGQRAHRARVARADVRDARAGARRPRRRGCVARGARRGRAPRSAMPRGWCSPRPTATSASTGAVADYLEVDAGYERAVEACLGDLLQHVVVERHEQAQPALRSCASARRRPLRLPRRRSDRVQTAAPAAGRCRRPGRVAAGDGGPRHRAVRAQRCAMRRSATRGSRDPSTARRPRG